MVWIFVGYEIANNEEIVGINNPTKGPPKFVHEPQRWSYIFTQREKARTRARAIPKQPHKHVLLWPYTKSPPTSRPQPHPTLANALHVTIIQTSLSKPKKPCDKY
ncbi:hypothetical protein ACOSP7_008759 [Xanthoceras sorbifolium]